MSRFIARTVAAAVLMSFASGCATTQQTTEEIAPDKRVAQEAPLGSRIKRKSQVAPVLGATREDLEQARVQQGAIATGIANDGR